LPSRLSSRGASAPSWPEYPNTRTREGGMAGWQEDRKTGRPCGAGTQTPDAQRWSAPRHRGHAHGWCGHAVHLASGMLGNPHSSPRLAPLGSCRPRGPSRSDRPGPAMSGQAKPSHGRAMSCGSRRSGRSAVPLGAISLHAMHVRSPWVMAVPGAFMRSGNLGWAMGTGGRVVSIALSGSRIVAAAPEGRPEDPIGAAF
jgi:hypothetical protein